MIENEDEDNTVSFKTKDGKYLYADGKDVKLVDTESKDGHTDFIKEEVKMTPEGSSEAEVLGYHLKCSKATIDGNAQYLETYKGCLTVYGNTTYTDRENGKPEEDNYLFDLNPLHVCEHAYAKDTDKGADASCTAPGEEVFICSKCKFSYTDEIPALGHEDKDGDGKCDREDCGEDIPTTATWSVATAIAAGDKIVFTATHKGKNYEMDGIHTNNYGKHAEIGSDGLAATYTLTVVEGKTTGTFAFKTSDNKYLCWKSGNTLTVESTLSSNSSWVVTFVDGEAQIMNAFTSKEAAGSQRIIYFNTNTTQERFATYVNNTNNASKFSLITIYKQS